MPFNYFYLSFVFHGDVVELLFQTFNVRVVIKIVVTIMASSESLFNLVDQLQHLESTVTNLIFEMAFKLSSLTSSNIFVMVENNLGRKYAGKSHLCAEYATIGLKALHNDIKVDFDPESGSLKEFPTANNHHHRVPDIEINENDLDDALFRHDFNITQKTSTPTTTTALMTNKKRRHSAALIAGEKRRRQYNRSLNVAVDPVSRSDEGGTISDPLARPNDLLQISKFEGDSTHYDSRNGGVGGNGCGTNNDDDDILIEEFTMDDDVSASVLNNHRNAKNGAVDNQTFDNRVPNNHFNPSREISSENGNGNISGDVDSYFQNNEKVAALRTLTFDVTGVEVDAFAPAFKIMTSVLYDVAKMASGTSPTSDKRDPHARAHFDKHFDRIMLEFPQLRMLTDQGVKVKTAGFGSFVRSTMQKTFGKLLDKALQADAKGAENHAVKTGNAENGQHLKSPFPSLAADRLEWNENALRWNS